MHSAADCPTRSTVFSWTGSPPTVSTVGRVQAVHAETAQPRGHHISSSRLVLHQRIHHRRLDIGSVHRALSLATPGTWTATRTSRNNSHGVTPSDYVKVTTSASVDSCCIRESTGAVLTWKRNICYGCSRGIAAVLRRIQLYEESGEKESYQMGVFTTQTAAVQGGSYNQPCGTFYIRLQAQWLQIC